VIPFEDLTDLMRRALPVIVCAITLAAAAPAGAQILPNWNVIAEKQEQLGEKHGFLFGAVEIDDGQTKLFADQVEVLDEEHAVATGNVVLTQGNNRITADRAEFNVKTKLGTFYNAWGIANIQPPRPTAPPAGGIVVPTMTGQENDVIFFGDKVEKIGYRKYRITNGGFSTCVQPTPRWNLSADTVVLNIDHYTFLKQAILSVKGVPMLYLPVLYYPTKEEDRATGFLIPTYGSSTVRGQSLHNAFFWAINRSQDATFMHDWYSKTGQGFGSEYRYNYGGESDGTFRVYSLNEHEASYVTNGQVSTSPAKESFMIDGGANQMLPGHLRARGRISYFSDITTNQTFSTNINTAASNTRSYGANVVGSWRTYSLNATVDRNEYFGTTTSSALTGSSPRLSILRNERPLFDGSPLYFSVNGEAAHLDRSTQQDDIVVDDRSLSRFDVTPQLRYPFKRWQFLTVNTLFSWRETFYTRSLDPVTQTVVSDDLNRQYFSVSANVVGPTLTRVWNTPDSEYADKFKHTIEPFFTAQRTSSIDDFNRIVQIDGTDIIYGGTTNLSYGLNNRLYAKRRTGQTSHAVEIASIEIRQTYYTNAQASQYDPRYTTTLNSQAPNNFSPIAINGRLAPANTLNGSVGIEIDSRYKKLRQLSANASYNLAARVQTTVGWSKRFLIEELPGFNTTDSLSQALTVSANARTRDNRYGSLYSMNYDVLRSTMIQQRVSAFYNAQCCGIAFEYQRYNYGAISYVVPSDHRFFLSFSLAGLGNFSPFNGALSGVPR
jgi:LPS-assembly protein